MNNRTKLTVKVVINNLITAFILFLLVFLGVHFTVGDKIDTAISLINRMSVEVVQNNSEQVNKITLSDKKKLSTYPNYGSKYGDLNISSADINLPIYYGDTLAILKNGIGHYDGSYFPGEGGSIIYAAHNSVGMFRNLPKVKKGDIVEVTTTYGNFKYSVYDTKIINENEDNKLPIQNDEEILMMYTCYPVTAIGHTTQRYVVYAKAVNE